MSVATKFPVTLSERLALGADRLRFPASWDEYLELLEECEYQIEYEDQHIIVMSIASDAHEVLVGNIGTLLNIALKRERNMKVRGSNRHVFIKEFKADYAPDAHIIKGKPEIYTLRKGLTANTNPWLVVEVLSLSTWKNDWRKKLPRYKKIPSLQHILYIEQERIFVTLFTRKGKSNIWEVIDFDKLEQSFSIAGHSISLTDLYDTVIKVDPQPEK